MRKIVIKYGGNAMTDEKIRKQILRIINNAENIGMMPILIHGGGPMLNEMFDRLGMESNFVNGLRCTDEHAIDVVVQVLSGKVNKSIVAEIQKLGGKAAGLSGADGNLIVGEAVSDEKGLEHVGKVKSINADIVEKLMMSGYIPVISTVGYGVDGKAYNINADMAAGQIAGAVGADSVIFMTDVDGLYRKFGDKNSLIERICIDEARSMIQSGIIAGGMIPKVSSCIEAVELGACRSFIINGEKPEILESLLSDIAASGTCGDRDSAEMSENNGNKKFLGTEFYDSKSYIKRESKFVANTYARYPVVIERGKGALCTDINGKEYIDFTSGIGVNSFGFADEKMIEAMTLQAKKVSHTSNLFYTKPMVELAERIIEKSGMSKVFFCNSGAEANEVAIKTARKHAYISGKHLPEIITLKNSFHGRTMATITATGQENYHRYFDPFLEGFRYAEANDITSVRACMNENTAAVMMELVQGEGGVLPLERNFVKEVEKLCMENGILLLVDEVQTGAGRCGDFLCSQIYGVIPDIVSMAKGLGGGMPVGACLFNNRTEDVLQPGDHGTTFGGNATVLAGACSIVERMDEDFFKEVRYKGELIRDVLRLHQDVIEDITGEGMMIGFSPKYKSASEVVKSGIELGVLALTAKERVRLLPPLNIEENTLLKGLELVVSACRKQ